MLADEVCSTEKMVNFCRDSPAKAVIIATEVGMLHRLQKECPEKQFIPAPTEKCACNECRFMKMNTLEKLHDCMANRTPEGDTRRGGHRARPGSRLSACSRFPRGNRLAKWVAFVGE